MKVLVVGGGSTGWIAAATLQYSLNGPGHGPVRITVVESPDTPRIGVGEATIPTFRDMLRDFHWPEAEFLRDCDASFKHGIRFDDWSGPGTSYLHPFQRLFLPELNGIAGEWLQGDRRRPFADYVSCQGALIAANRGPRAAAGPGLEADLPYAYHMDAEAFADALCRRLVNIGVTHVPGTVATVARDNAGHVTSVDLSDGRRLTADLFVDCTGFRALLTPEAHTPEGWVDGSDALLCDRAVTLRIPEDPARFVPDSHTTARALSAGWAWNIGLRRRRGRGYVYAARHLTPEAAEAELRATEGARAEGVEARHLSFRVGRQTRPWRGNVVALGLAAGFLEPLESTGLFLAHYGARCLAAMFPPTPGASADPALSARFNQLQAEMFDDTLDFIQLHYAVAQRRDTPFWRDAADPARLTPRLRMLLGLWENRPPVYLDFSLRYPPFTDVNYEFILLGSGWAPRGLARSERPLPVPGRVAAATAQAVQVLPEHGRLLAALA